MWVLISQSDFVKKIHPGIYLIREAGTQVSWGKFETATIFATEAEVDQYVQAVTRHPIGWTSEWAEWIELQKIQINPLNAKHLGE